jgi:hypothetical protein
VRDWKGTRGGLERGEGETGKEREEGWEGERERLERNERRAGRENIEGMEKVEENKVNG